MNWNRFLASVLAMVAGTLSGVSMLSAWWSLSLSTGGHHYTLSFLPGNALTASVDQSPASGTYASVGLGQVGGLYEAVLAFGIVVTLLSIVAGIVGLLWTFGTLCGPSRGSAFEMLTIGLAIVSVGAIALVPLVQPSALASGSFIPCSSSGGGSPCNSFWGTISGPNGTGTWGADAGWYLEIGAIALLLGAFVQWLTSRDEPWIVPRPASQVGVPSSARAAPLGGPSSVHVPGTQRRSAPGPRPNPARAASAPDRYCPACGCRNSRASAFCGGCGRALSPPPRADPKRTGPGLRH